MKTPSTIPALMPRFVTRRALCTAMLWLLLSTLNSQLSTILAQDTDFTYQGRLEDAGSPAGGIYDLRFAIYDALAGGAQQGNAITNSPILVSNGLFTVTLNFGASVFSGSDRWLEIGVRTNGSGDDFQTLSPRQPIMPTPYAIRAANFSGNVAASQLTGIISPGNIGAGSINSTMLADGAVTASKLAAGAVTSSHIAAGAVGVNHLESAVATTGTLIITNPTPVGFDRFGIAVAALGSDRVLVGAEADDTGGANAGAAYLFNVNGTLLTTFTNPAPAGDPFGDLFGASVAVVGNDRVLISAYRDDRGAMDAGVVYLFSTNGTLLTTFTNPAPEIFEFFGISVAGIGNDRVLIGAHQDNTGANDAGAAYLFSTSGTLLTTFTNPTPTDFEYFGFSVAGFGNDRVLIGSPRDDTGAFDAGVAYLFSTNGTLLTTFTNPTPAANEAFGFPLVAVGEDRVLIGSYQDLTGGTNAGAAYLFDTNGTLLATFTNPTPTSDDQFGFAMAVVENDRVLIGAWQDDTGAPNAGAAYLFNTNGTLLATFTNPTPANNEGFSISLAAVGGNRLLIGAYQDNTAVPVTGAAYLLSIQAFMPGLVAEGVRAGAITSESIAAGAVTTEHLAAGAVGANQLAAGAVTTTSLADGAVTADKMNTISDWFLEVTIGNPTPAIGDKFAYALAAVGNDRVLIGTPEDNTGAAGAGAAYLFSLNGTLLTAFTNPTPAALDGFGVSVAAVGNDRLLIGSPNLLIGGSDVAAAYLFSTNGVLLRTFTDPTPTTQDAFGASVAALGNDRVLIGAPTADTGATNAGVAYLFSTNGGLLTTFTNPTPAAEDLFGFGVAAIGNDRVLIAARGDDTGAPEAGAAYLFSTNGTLLTTFTNPTPAMSDVFGISVAALGNNHVLIGAFQDDTGAADAGAAYLFSVSGALLTTFTNPTPASADNFGLSVTAVGLDQVLIGASGDNTGADSAGAAYLFGTNGLLLATFTNPTPASLDFFGTSVAAMGSDRVVIGAYRDNTGAEIAGAAYLFSKEPFTPGLVADSVRPGGIASDLTIGVWTRGGNDDIFRASGNVGIGTTSPQAALHVNGTVILGGEFSDYAYSGQDGNGLFIEQKATTPAKSRVRIQSSKSGDLLNYAQFNVDPNFGFSFLNFGTGNFRVGIGRNAVINALEVEGNASKTTAGSFLANSDERIKTNVQTVTGALDKLSQVRLVEFHYTDAYRAQHPSLEDRTYLNVVAQEFQKVFPEHVQSSGEKFPDGDTILQVDTHPLTIYSAAAIQELNRKLDAGDQKSEDRNQRSENRIRKLETENAELKARLEHLERRLSKSHSH